MNTTWENETDYTVGTTVLSIRSFVRSFVRFLFCSFGFDQLVVGLVGFGEWVGAFSVFTLCTMSFRLCVCV